jgi:hypothetical protein
VIAKPQPSPLRAVIPLVLVTAVCLAVAWKAPEADFARWREMYGERVRDVLMYSAMV